MKIQKCLSPLYHGLRAYDVGLEFGIIETDEIFTIFELLRFIAPEKVDEVVCQAIDTKVLGNCLLRMAGIFRETCTPFLKLDMDVITKLRGSIEPLRRERTLRAQHGATIERADIAWKDKDFVRAKSLYQKSGEALDKTRSRRLNYLHSKYGD